MQRPSTCIILPTQRRAAASLLLSLALNLACPPRAPINKLSPRAVGQEIGKSKNMARLSATTVLLAAVAFLVAAAEAGPRRDGDAITKDFIFARGIKLDVDDTQSKIGIPLSRLAVSQSKVAIPLMSKVAVPKKGVSLEEGRMLIGDVAGAAPAALQACDQLEAYQRVCHTLLHLPGVTTERALLETAVRVALGRARAAKVTFDAAMLASKVGNPVASILGSCEQNYDDLVDALEGVSRAMQKPGTTGESLVNKMTAASTYAGDCDNWYQERDIKSPYETMQRHLAQMVSVALGLANKIKKL
ncbi:hypothetical protein D1007_09115 [Hordeum vulgare]|nr:hypothetical protein D1007_09115 [Hordeum vulgare]